MENDQYSIEKVVHTTTDRINVERKQDRNAVPYFNYDVRLEKEADETTGALISRIVAAAKSLEQDLN